MFFFFFFFSSRRRHTRLQGDWSSDVCSSDLRYSAISSSDHVSPVWGSGVMFGTSDFSGPCGLPARKRELSVAYVIVRGVWHSPQCPTARTRYSPRAVPLVGAADGGVSRGANAASQAGKNTDSNIGTMMRFG